MSKNLHELQVEIVANMKKFRKTCEAVRAEARKTTRDANKALSQIGDSNTGQGVTKQYKQIQKETKAICNTIKGFFKDAQIDAGILVPTKEYKALEKDIASTEKRIDSLVEKQKALKNTGPKTAAYEKLESSLKTADKRLEELVEKQAMWDEMGVDQKSAPYRELSQSIRDTFEEISRCKAGMEDLEKSGNAFAPSEKFKMLQRDITEAREELAQYRKEEARMAANGTDYNSTIKPKKESKAQSPTVQLAKAYGAAGKRAIEGVVTQTAKVHPSLEKAIRLAEKFGNTAKKAGNVAGKGIKTAAAPMKGAVSFLKLLSTGFGKVYQKIRQIIPGMNKFRSSADSMANSCGKLMGKMGALRITATYMLASFMIMGGINAMKEGFKSLSQYSTRTNADLSMLMSSLTQLRNSLATAFAPILSVVAPILNTFVSWLSTAMTAVAHFMAAITGQSQVVVSKKVNQDFAGSIADTGSAADDAKDSVDKYKKSLMGFDRINKLDSQDSSSSTSGSGNSGVSASDMFETVKVDSTFANWADKFKQAWENADFTEIGTIVGRKLNNALKNIPWDDIKTTAGNIAKSLATFLNGFIKETDWNLVGKTFAEGVNTVIGFAHTFVTTFDWTSFGTAISNAIEGFLLNIDWAKAGETFSTGFKGIFSTINTVLTETDWKAIGSKIGEFLKNVDWIGVLTSVGTAIVNAVIAVLDFADGLFTSICEGLQDVDWKAVISAVWELIKTAWGLVGKVLEVGISLLKNGWDTLLDFIGIKPKGVDQKVNRKANWTDGIRKFLGLADEGTAFYQEIARKAGWDDQTMREFMEMSPSEKEAFIQKVGREKGWDDKTIREFLGMTKSAEAVKNQKISRSAGWKDTIRRFLGLTDKEDGAITQKIGRKKKWGDGDGIRSFLGLSKDEDTAKYQKIGRKAGWDNQTMRKFLGMSDEEKQAFIQKVARGKGWDNQTIRQFLGLTKDSKGSVSQKIGRTKGWNGTTRTFLGLTSSSSSSLSQKVSLKKSGFTSIKKWLGIDGDLKLKFKLPKIKVKWGEKTVAGFKISYPNGFETYAKGGFPEEGPFMMNRGEIAGKFSNGKGVVANNQQITTGIANAVGPAVYKAVLSAMAMSSDNNGNVTIVLEGDAKGLFKVVKQEAQKYTNATGQTPFPV